MMPHGLADTAVRAGSVIVDDFDVKRRLRAVVPREADTPLVIDADAVLSFPITAQGLEAISRRIAKIEESSCSKKSQESCFCRSLGHALEATDTPPVREVLSILVAE